MPIVNTCLFVGGPANGKREVKSLNSFDESLCMPYYHMIIPKILEPTYLDYKKVSETIAREQCTYRLESLYENDTQYTFYVPDDIPKSKICAFLLDQLGNKE